MDCGSRAKAGRSFCPRPILRTQRCDFAEVTRFPKSMAEPQSATRSETHALLEVFSAFLKLGLTSFGGPIAHLGYFRDEFVARRRWLDEKAYADLVALCQFLPGPASSQVGMSIGILRAGI